MAALDARGRRACAPSGRAAARPAATPARAARVGGGQGNLVDRRAFSWTDLLARLEQVAAPGGAPGQSIAPHEPEGRRGADPERGRPAPHEDALALVKALQARQDFDDVFLTGGSQDGPEGRSIVYVSLRLARPPVREPPAPREGPQRLASASPPFWRRRLLPAFLGAAGPEPRSCSSAWTVPRGARQRSAGRAGRGGAGRGGARARGRRAAARARGGDPREQRRRRALLPHARRHRAQRTSCPRSQEVEDDGARTRPAARAPRGYTREAVKGAPLERVAITLPLEGTYAAARRASCGRWSARRAS